MKNEASMPPSPTVQLKRAYEPSEVDDGVRVLVDRLWARGVSKDSANLDAWMKELGPSAELRRWFGHQAGRWDAFAEKYRLELKTPLRQLLLAELQGIVAGSTLTLVYGARNTKENEAVVLRQCLLHDTISLDGSWDAPTKLLITASVVAAAHRDAHAPASVLKLFASPILPTSEYDGALQELVPSGKLRESSDGWQLTTSGDREARQLASAATVRRSSRATAAPIADARPSGELPPCRTPGGDEVQHLDSTPQSSHAELQPAHGDACPLSGHKLRISRQNGTLQDRGRRPGETVCIAQASGGFE